MSKKPIKKRKRPGQPPLPENLKRAAIQIRLNDVERAKLEKFAAKAGLALTTFIRQKALGEI
jgi:hypothetical protein